MARYINPVPGGTIGRTDQGVDISATPGTPVLAITKERLMGVIQNWYQGQPFYWFQELNAQGKPTGIYNYVAEQFNSIVQRGQVVNQGQPIGEVAPSGTGLEFGYATPNGRTRASTQGGYTEGIPTQAGQDYKSQVIGQGSPSNLAQLWIQAGGSPRLANTMAAIALAESSGRVGATHKNTNGSIDRGLWQINSVHSQFDSQKLVTDPLYNAKAAVSVYKSQGLTAWSTYNSRAYLAYVTQGSKATPNYGGPNGGYTRPGGDVQVASITSDYTNLRNAPRKQTDNGGGGIFGPINWWWGQVSSNWNQFESDVNGATKVITAPIDAMNEAVTILQELPWYMLRTCEFVTGITFMGIGLYMAISPRGSHSSPIGGIIEGTAIGRAMRIRSARTAGRREGQAEHHRLKARREARTSEAEVDKLRGTGMSQREARKTQRAGQKRRTQSK